MGSSTDTFYKYPRTPHLFGSRGTSDDKHLGQAHSEKFLRNPGVIVEEKLDGTNVGIHFLSTGRMVLQCRGHEITEGMHAQYDLFKQWAAFKQPLLAEVLGQQYILYGEWLYARHTVYYRELPHYFFEFDVFDKAAQRFLDLPARQALLEGTGICTVPVLHRGPITHKELLKLIGPSSYASEFIHPGGQKTDDRMEGLYLRTDEAGATTGRAKYVRPEFVARICESTHWQQQQLVANQLASGVSLFA